MTCARGVLIFACFAVLAGCEGDPLESDPVDSGAPTDATFDATSDTFVGEGGVAEVGPDALEDSTIDTDVTDTALDDADATGDDADATGDETGADAEAGIDDADAAGDDAETGGDETGVADAADADTGSDVGDAPAPASGEVWVVRVGDGVTDLDVPTFPVVIERVRLSDGALLGEIPLPTAAAAGQHALTIGGKATAEGVLLRSADERFVTLVGYDAGPGAEFGTKGVLRTVARIDASGVVDTSTTTSSYDGFRVHAAVTSDGGQYWLAGSHGTDTGVTYLPSHGSSLVATPISTGLAVARSVNILSGALYGTSPSGAVRVYDFGSALPTTATAPAALSGMPTTGGAHQVVGVPGEPDLLYVCDDGGASVAVKRWRRTSGTWALEDTLSSGLTQGCRGVAAEKTTGGIRLVVGAAGPESKLFTAVDTGVGVPTFTEVRSAPEKTVYRGLAFAPH